MRMHRHTNPSHIATDTTGGGGEHKREKRIIISFSSANLTGSQKQFVPETGRPQSVGCQ
jgi:hypothetical protein